MNARAWAVGLGLLLLFVAAIVADDAPARAKPKKVSFSTDIYPLLSTRCLRCHQGNNAKSGVRLDSRSELLGVNNGRPLAISGQGAKSRLVLAISGELADKVMPPEGRGKRLRADQVALFRAWIDQGLDWDDKLLPPPAAPKHWSLQPLRRGIPPVVVTMGKTPIDAFILQAWHKHGLKPVASASRQVLIRRLTLDLFGIPPTPDEVHAFLEDTRPDAYERLVDRLLASPRYGERWGRHWLDVARYADSEGYESNHPRAHAWHYRDWVTDSFNRDRSYASFIRSQIAGDEIRPYADDNLIATGFLAAARLSSNEEDTFRQRNDMLVDVTNTTASAFLGLTMQCAQCHNHKFDPITARDYYRWQAFFIGGQPVNLALQDARMNARWRAAVPENYDRLQSQKERLWAEAKARLVAAARKKLPRDEAKALDIAEERRTDEQERLARQAQLKLQFARGKIEAEARKAKGSDFAGLSRRLASIEKTTPPRPQTFGYYSPATAASKLDVLPMLGFYPLPLEPKRLATMKAHLLVGGDVHGRGPALEPGWPAVFGDSPAPDKSPRLALADWLSSPNNPLTTRVFVNRLWQWHFGHGLVRTSSDFGLKGAPPSHPELLDWLAAEFRRSGGSTKHLHRLIVLSSVYQLSSTGDATNARIDPDNRYLWHWSVRRLEAEPIRDSMLSVTGELAARIGGPPDANEVKSRRRGLYLLQKRDQPPAVQGLFDGPSASAESCPQRQTSTVPLQALYLLNNKFAHDRAEALARRVSALSGDDRHEQVRMAWQLTLGRNPRQREYASAQQFFTRHGEAGALTALCQALMNINEFCYLE